MSLENKISSVVGNSSISTNTPSTANSSSPNYKLPDNLTLQNACKLAMVEDKAVMMDYWSCSLEKKCLIGIKDTGEKLLVKSADEYTSPIQKFYKCNGCFIIITENSIYIVESEIPTRKIS
jgi:hypothetical protein